MRGWPHQTQTRGARDGTAAWGAKGVRWVEVWGLGRSMAFCGGVVVRCGIWEVVGAEGC